MKHTQTRLPSLIGAFSISILLTFASESIAKEFPTVISPDFEETRTVELTQRVTLAEIPEGAKIVKMWIPFPSDHQWQRVLDVTVDSVPGDWEIVSQPEGRGEFLYVEVTDPSPGKLETVICCLVQREGIHFPLEKDLAAPVIQTALFEASLNISAPLMIVDEDVRKLAQQAVGKETDTAKQAALLVRKVAEFADHYSKDPTKPHCGRGSAQDCLENGGGCCTDLHSLFISMARARGIAARMQYGYRLLDAKEGQEFNPGYRCWVEYFIPGAGWVPTDIVAADNADEANPYRWSSLGPYRVWLWEGRSFELAPKSNHGRVDTMLCGWAEIDGEAVDPLPGKDGTPPQMTRTVSFKVVDHDRPKGAPKLPE